MASSSRGSSPRVEHTELKIDHDRAPDSKERYEIIIVINLSGLSCTCRKVGKKFNVYIILNSLDENLILNEERIECIHLSIYCNMFHF